MTVRTAAIWSIPPKPKVYACTIERGRSDNPTPFDPPSPEMKRIVQDITAALLQF